MPMKLKYALRKLGCTQSELARTLGITRQAVANWKHRTGKSNPLIPEAMAYRLFYLTGDKLKINPKDYMG